MICTIRRTRCSKGKYRIEELDERDKDKQNNPTYSLILISYRTDENLTGQIHNVFYQTDEYEILGKKFNVIGIKHFGYDPTIAADGKTVVQVVINTDERMYKKLQEMRKEEYDAFKGQIAEKMKDAGICGCGRKGTASLKRLMWRRREHCTLCKFVWEHL